MNPRHRGSPQACQVGRTAPSRRYSSSEANVRPPHPSTTSVQAGYKKGGASGACGQAGLWAYISRTQAAISGSLQPSRQPFAVCRGISHTPLTHTHAHRSLHNPHRQFRALLHSPFFLGFHPPSRASRRARCAVPQVLASPGLLQVIEEKNTPLILIFL